MEKNLKSDIYIYIICISESVCRTLAGEGSACNARDPGSIPGLGISPGEGTGSPFQYSWASLVVQTIKNPPVVREAWV